MPSQKTAEKKAEKPIEKKIETVTVIANRKFAVDLSKEEVKRLQADDKDHRSFEGMTKLIEPGEKADISKEIAKKLQKAGVIQIAL